MRWEYDAAGRVLCRSLKRDVNLQSRLRESKTVKLKRVKVKPDFFSTHLEPAPPMNVWIRGIFSWLRDGVSFHHFSHVNVTPVVSRIR